VKKILYLPIGTFSPVTVKKIRQFHVLDDHQVRRYIADDESLSLRTQITAEGESKWILAAFMSGRI
jgi:hypothetical protein